MTTARLPPYISVTDKVILFDGVCRLCSAWVRFLIRFDHHCQFKLASVQSKEGQAILEWYGLPIDYFETMLLIEGPNVYTQSTAFIRVMVRLQWFWKLTAVVWLIPKSLRNWVYDRIALNRYALFGRNAVCLLSHPEHEGRFLNASALEKQ